MKGGAARLLDFCLLIVFLALPVAGLVRGPIYGPLILGLGALRLATLLATDRPALRQAPPLAALALAFCGLCWASVAWSIVPSRSLAGAAQASLVLGLSLAFLASGTVARATAERLARWWGAAFLVGAAILVADRLSGFHLSQMIDAHERATKYNRGVDYALLSLFPLLGLLAARRHWLAVAGLAVAALAIVAAAPNSTAKLALPAACLVLAAAKWRPRLTEKCLAGATGLTAIGLPFLVRLITGERSHLLPYLKESAFRRLEIWDYVSARLTERPLLGWGIWSANALPIHADELRSYLDRPGEGIYPHNQWLELWVETGALGAAIGLAFALLTLWRIRRLSPSMQPFAYAAFTVALAISCTSFEVTTDSWWGALLASGFLFAAFDPLASPDQIAGRIRKANRISTNPTTSTAAPR